MKLASEEAGRAYTKPSREVFWFCFVFGRHRKVTLSLVQCHPGKGLVALL